MNTLQRGLIVAAGMGGFMLLGHTAAHAATDSSSPPVASAQVLPSSGGTGASVTGTVQTGSGQPSTATACVLGGCGGGSGGQTPPASTAPATQTSTV
ncbi:MAG TPA: hypothetical protein VIX86_25570, partial [Streptosporangiaceae bacterium]